MPKNLLYFLFLIHACALAFSQQYPLQQQTSPVEPMNPTPVYRVNVVSRSTKAVNYRHHSGKTDLDFIGTNVMPQASGRATVESRTGRMEINADLDYLQPSRSFGPEYLTYVLWAVSPEGSSLQWTATGWQPVLSLPLSVFRQAGVTVAGPGDVWMAGNLT